MAWRYHGRARVNARNPEAFGVCDRCCFWFNLNDLQFQHDWRGNKLQCLYIRVCKSCLDKPFGHYRPIITPPDPIPVRQPRIDQYAVQMPYVVTDTTGREVDDTQTAFVTASSQRFPPPLSGASASAIGLVLDNLAEPLIDDNGQPITAEALGPVPQILTTPQAMDRYVLRAPNGGPVIIIPD